MINGTKLKQCCALALIVCLCISTLTGCGGEEKKEKPQFNSDDFAHLGTPEAVATPTPDPDYIKDYDDAFYQIREEELPDVSGLTQLFHTITEEEYENSTEFYIDCLNGLGTFDRLISTGHTFEGKTVYLVCDLILDEKFDGFGGKNFAWINVNPVDTELAKQLEESNEVEDVELAWTPSEDGYMFVSDADLSGCKLYGETKETMPKDAVESYFAGTFSGKYKGVQYHLYRTKCKPMSKPAGEQLFGLFTHVKGGTVTDVSLRGVKVDPARRGPICGGIAACVTNGTIKNCTVESGVILGEVNYRYLTRFGGIAGLAVNGSVISNCTVNAKMGLMPGMGGITSQLMGSTIEDCHVNQCYAVNSYDFSESDIKKLKLGAITYASNAEPWFERALTQSTYASEEHYSYIKNCSATLVHDDNALDLGRPIPAFVEGEEGSPSTVVTNYSFKTK